MFGREDSAMQRRVKDLEAAGLHKTLAAGQGAAAQPGASSQSMPGQMPASNKEVKMGVLESALMGEQVKSAQAQRALTNAEADRVRNTIKNDDIRIGMEQENLGLKSSAENRAQALHTPALQRAALELRNLLSQNENLLKQGKKIDEEIIATTLRRQLDEEDLAYVKANKMKMPVRDKTIGEIISLLNALGVTQRDFSQPSVINSFLEPVKKEEDVKRYKIPLTPGLGSENPLEWCPTTRKWTYKDKYKVRKK